MKISALSRLAAVTVALLSVNPLVAADGHPLFTGSSLFAA